MKRRQKRAGASCAIGRGESFSDRKRRTTSNSAKLSLRQSYLVFSAAVSIIVYRPIQVEAGNPGTGHCIVREGHVSIVGPEITALYEKKLFVTQGNLARYVFLTNANYDGDRSVALYRRPATGNSLPGDYWLTSTEVSTSLVACLSAAREKRPGFDPANIKVRRSDAALPASTAQVVRDLWLELLNRSRVDEKAVPSAPTAIIYAANLQGVGLKAVTVGNEDDTACLGLMRFGQSLTNYPQLPQARRMEAARKLEDEGRTLLEHVKRR